jgi:phosphatidylglycerol:prolipoprotein diacylglycerol transferase
MIPFTPDPVLFSIGPITVYWYGVMYAVGLVAVWLVLSWEARRRGLDTGLLANGMIIVAAAALAGGRLYHVIDQWQLYQDDLLRILLPPYAGLGAFGGLITGTIAGVLYALYKKQDVLVWADVAMPGVLVMQAFARWGNFFNQELYGPPTNLPWGIAIDCTHRIPAYPCETYPFESTHFQPLFLYESLSGAIGAIVLLWVARRFPARLLKGDIALLVVAWYSTTRFLLEPLRADNWTFNGIPTASIVAGALAVGAIAILLVRHALHRGRPAEAVAATAGATGDAEVAAGVEGDARPEVAALVPGTLAPAPDATSDVTGSPETRPRGSSGQPTGDLPVGDSTSDVDLGGGI